MINLDICFRYKIFLIVLLACVNMSVYAQTKRALVIGIGKHEDSMWKKINGDKDVPYVLEFLKDANFGQVLTCVNEKATKACIVAGFKTLEQSCEPNDIVYVHFSGHGQQMKDKSSDEQDLLDECWIPYDAYCKPCSKDRGEKHLVDDEVNGFLTNIRNKIGDGGKMLVVVDACHSGDATRSGGRLRKGETIRGADSVFVASKASLELPANGTRSVKTNAERWITLSACESEQVNIEMKNPKVGKLTYALYRELKNKEAGNNYEFFHRLKKFVNSNSGSRAQRPTMTGETGRYNITDILR